ncbi:uncharacterized protein VTP21DRAFT_8880 [Calcarisporiella thermophila]|uniref:uncharacterized protein n=1 Tax=Calcarisporiella thermophila TaxID=911321 RepID=UPI0037436AA4
MANNTALDKNIIDDHKLVGRLYEHFLSTKDNTERQKVANTIIRELVKHSVGEEMVLYPLCEKHLGSEGTHVAEESRREHKMIEKMLYELDGMRVTDAGYASKFEEVMRELRKHNEEEETDLLPKLRNVVKENEWFHASGDFEKYKSTAPTRPHPSAPASGSMAQAAAGVTAAGLDKIRDTNRDYVDVARFKEE